MLDNVQVPLKRVNQVYVIATTTKVPVDKIDLSKFEDSYFKATEKKTTKKGESEFFESEPEKKVTCGLDVYAPHTILTPPCQCNGYLIQLEVQRISCINEVACGFINLNLRRNCGADFWESAAVYTDFDSRGEKGKREGNVTRFWATSWKQS